MTPPVKTSDKMVNIGTFMELAQDVKANFEAKLEEAGCPLELSWPQVVQMAMKETYKRQEAEKDYVDSDYDDEYEDEDEDEQDESGYEDDEPEDLAVSPEAA